MYCECDCGEAWKNRTEFERAFQRGEFAVFLRHKRYNAHVLHWVHTSDRCRWYRNPKGSRHKTLCVVKKRDGVFWNDDPLKIPQNHPMGSFLTENLPDNGLWRDTELLTAVFDCLKLK